MKFVKDPVVKLDQEWVGYSGETFQGSVPMDSTKRCLDCRAVMVSEGRDSAPLVSARFPARIPLGPMRVNARYLFQIHTLARDRIVGRITTLRVRVCKDPALGPAQVILFHCFTYPDPPIRQRPGAHWLHACAVY
jgi:hypothetical protein